LKLRVEAAVRSARLALQDGVVPGCGAALLRCTRTLEALDARGEELLGVRAVARALSEPMRAILDNAGLDAGRLVECARESQLVYDVLNREWVDAWSTGLVDPLAVQLAALETAGSTAAVALTTDVLIHRKNAPTVVRP
jgi:chaperonin GroEL